MGRATYGLLIVPPVCDTTTVCSLQSRYQGEGREFIFGLYIVNNFPYGKLKIKNGERKNEKDVNCYDDGGDGYGIYGV